jgi:hypothetical protein
MNRLLIVACSHRKKAGNGQLPAIERYDGPAFRVLRKYLRERRGPMPRILILSAKYGLIDAVTPIRNYDLRMTKATAEALRPVVLKRLRKVLRADSIRSVGVCLGADYREAVEGLEAQISEGTRVEVIGGGLGRRLTRLRDWLYRDGVMNDASFGERGGEKSANEPAGPRAGRR